MMEHMLSILISSGAIKILGARYDFTKDDFIIMCSEMASGSSFNSARREVTLELKRSKLVNFQSSATGSSGPQKMLLDYNNLRKNNDASVIIKFTVPGQSTKQGLPSVIYASSDSPSIKKFSETATSQPIYITKCPDGEDCIFTPKDLVAGRGTITSKKGKKFKPKKWKPYSLSEKVKNWKPKGN